jgi:hypothetical protein
MSGDDMRNLQKAPEMDLMRFELFADIVQPDGVRKRVNIGEARRYSDHPQQWLFSFQHIPLDGEVLVDLLYVSVPSS